MTTDEQLHFFDLQFYKQFSRKIFTVLLMIPLMLMPENFVQACGGTPAPPCGRSVWLAKFTPGVVVFPAAGVINIPIGVLPFAQWNTTGVPGAAVCPQPLTATMSLTLTCFPSGTVIGPQAIPVPVPVTPGIQPLGGPVNFTIPAGLFPPGTPPQICLVTGVYSLTFTDGITLVANGDTEVCIVPPTPLDENKPRLDMQYLSPDDDGFKTCRRGDQADFYFLIANNDPDESVSLDLSSIGRQISHLPEGFTAQDAYANDVYAISLPEPGTDTYAASFTDDLQPGELMAEPDPFTPNDQSLSKSFTLLPCEAIIIGVSMRSYGMCANGSCNERLLKVEGTFQNGDPALACASTLLVVDEAPPKSVLCEIFDSIKVSDFSEAMWTPGQFSDLNGPIPHASTFAAGNLPPSPTFTAFRTTGQNSPDLFPSSASDYARLDRPVAAMNYVVDFNSQQCDGGVNAVSLLGLDNFNNFPLAVPAIRFQFVTEPLDIILNLPANQIQILAQGEPLFQGPIDIFFADPPPEFCIDPGICRIISKQSDFSDKAIYVRPPTQARLFPDSKVIIPACDTLNVFDQNGNPALWDATISGMGLGLTAASGTDGLIETCYEDLDLLPAVPETTITYVEVSCPGAINNVVRIPYAIRVKHPTSNRDLYPSGQEERFILHAVAPNPFKSSTTISYTLMENTTVSLKMYNYLGEEVYSLFENKRLPPGEYTSTWVAQTHTGTHLAPGIYICKLFAGTEIKTTNMVLIE